VKIKLLSGEVIDAGIGQALSGRIITEITFTNRDMWAIAHPKFDSWMKEVVLCKFLPPERNTPCQENDYTG
jgi:hypothetical protein